MAAPELLKQAIGQFQQGDFAGAEKTAKTFLRSARDHPEGHHLLGLIAFQQGDAHKAAKLIGRAVGAGSTSPEHHKNHGYALKALGRLDGAAQAYSRALELAPMDSAAWNDLGNVQVRLGRYREAETSFKRSIELAPDDPKPFVNLASLLSRLNRSNEAVVPSRKAVELAPKLAAAHNALGNAMRGVGKLDAAIDSFERAREIEPDAIDPLTNLAAVMEETSRTAEAGVLCETVLDRHPGHAAAGMILARCLRRQGDPEAALERLERIDEAQVPIDLRRDIAHERSLLYDRAGDSTRAFDAMVLSNALSMQAMGVDETLGDPFLERVEALQSWVRANAGGAVAEIPTVHDGLEDPVFLIGFPRSGTTLLGQVLDSHSGLIMAEEQTFLDAVIAELENREIPYPDGIGNIDAETFTALRALYAKRFDAAFDRRAGERMVDKFPLHLIHVGLIRKLFPQAKLLLALRHPCDVVLSCFMQSFSPNPAMANFFSVERAARTYDAVMSLWRAYEEILQPDAHIVRYESVVTDFDVEISAMLAYLGLEWEDGLRNFTERARERGKIHTPSYSQVTEKLYTRARYRWQRYEEQLAPVLPVLVPWIERFGYADSDV